MTRTIIKGKKTRIEGQPTNTNKMVYTKISGASLISVIYISAVLRINKRKHYTLPKYYHYNKKLDWTLSIYLHTVVKSI